MERHICYSLRVTTVKVSIPPAKQFLAKGSVISDLFFFQEERERE